ncbi:hypothetical protein WUBG_18221, partial [Wuchereria bancrofti]
TGSISKEDFIRYMSTPPAHHTTLTELERYFRLYDNDGDGAITIGISYIIIYFSPANLIIHFFITAFA